MQTILSWMKAGDPAHWMWFAAAAYMMVEWALPRTEKTQANSLLELVANMLRLIPGIGVLVGKLGTQVPPSIEPMEPTK